MNFNKTEQLAESNREDREGYAKRDKRVIFVVLRALKTTKFCLCPRGNKAWSPRLMDAVWFGCIPVVIADHYVLPLGSLVDWESIAVTVAEKQVRGEREKEEGGGKKVREEEGEMRNERIGGGGEGREEKLGRGYCFSSPCEGV